MSEKLNKRINVGDRVVVTSGNEKGKTGKVIARTEKRVIIEGLNMRKKHVKPQSRTQPGIVSMEGPMHASNVCICDEDGKSVKIKVKAGENGKRQLVYTKDGKEVVYRDVKKKKD